MLDRMTARTSPRNLALMLSFLLCGCGNFSLVGGTRIQSEDAELRSAALRMLGDLERLSGLKAIQPIHVARQNESELRDLLYAAMNESREEMTAALEAYVILGIAPQTFDAYTIMNSQASEIAGYYDPETKKLYVLDNVPPEGVEVVLAHELVHALQDQHIDLKSNYDSHDDDRGMAFQAVVEGHASMVMAAWMIEQVTGGRVNPAAMPSVADQLRRSPIVTGLAIPNGPRALQRIFYFPYIEGSSFVRTLWKFRPDRLAVGLDSLRPSSTEQVLNAERSLLAMRDEPMDVAFEPPPLGWMSRHETILGEFGMRLVLEENLGSNAATAANGWRGDRVRLLDDGGAGRVLQWRTVWDDEARATAFDQVARKLIASRGPRWSGRVTRSALAGVPMVQVEFANSPVWLGGTTILAR